MDIGSNNTFSNAVIQNKFWLVDMAMEIYQNITICQVGEIVAMLFLQVRPWGIDRCFDTTVRT